MYISVTFIKILFSIIIAFKFKEYFKEKKHPDFKI